MPSDVRHRSAFGLRPTVRSRVERSSGDPARGGGDVGARGRDGDGDEAARAGRDAVGRARAGALFWLCVGVAGCHASSPPSSVNVGVDAGDDGLAVEAATTGGSWAEADAASSAGGADAGAGLRAFGTLVTSAAPLPSDVASACEAAWTVRTLIYHPDPKVPRRMYFAACTPPGGRPRQWISLSVVDTAGTVSGALLEAEVDATTGALTPLGDPRRFPECKELHGVAAKSDCSMVGVLCRRDTNASATDAPTLDMVAALPDTGSGGERWWLTQPGSTSSGQVNDEEWLYEWPDGDVTQAPSTYVAHKAIGGWAYGSQALVYGEADDTFGLSLKSTVFGGGEWHQGDALLVVRRQDHTIDPQRGWYWGCAAGHTIFNHPAFNPATSQYAVACGTDLGVDATNDAGFSGLWVHSERGTSRGYLSAPLWKSLSFGGGPTSLVPLADGGFLGVFTGVDGVVAANLDYRHDGPVTSIGLARFDGAGALVGPVKRLASSAGEFLSFPQLAPLGDGAYLFGYADMVSLADQQDPTTASDDALRVPASYHLQEIDEDGAPLSTSQTLTDVGWGEQDTMVPLADGSVGWAYTPTPVRTGAVLPPCTSDRLALHVYTRR